MPRRSGAHIPSHQKRVVEVLSLGVKQPGHEADNSSPSTAKVKNAWHYTSTLPYIFMAWCLIKHKDIM
jgi:hypothetical protein